MAEYVFGPENGSVTLANNRFNAKWLSFTCNLENPRIERNVFGQSSPVTKPGTGAVRGTITGLLQFNGANTKPFPTTIGNKPDFANFQDTLTLQYESGCTVSGTATFSNVQIPRTSDNDFSTVTMDYQFDGDPTVTWDTAS